MSHVDYGPDAVQWAARLARWAQRRRLHGLLAAALDLGEPLGPVGAQVLWIAQPALSVFLPRAEIDTLARVIEAPGGVAWLRDQIDEIAPDIGQYTAQGHSDTGGKTDE